MRSGWRERRLSPSRHRFEVAFGGRARTRIVLLLSAVLALSTADAGMVGALARQLEAAFGISHAGLGLVAAVSSGFGAFIAMPVGVLADRVARVRLLVMSVGLWSVALVAGGAAQSYLWLLLSRVALGAGVAATGPLLASLIGDLIVAKDRAKVYGWIQTGEMIGAGVGLFAGGGIGFALSWRYAFWLLAVVGAGLGAAIFRWLPEPARGGSSRVPPGATAIPHSSPVTLRAGGAEAGRVSAGEAWRSLAGAFVLLMRVRTIVILVVASSIGYFFFAGLRTFAVVFVMERYRVGVGQLAGLGVMVGAGALAGAVLGGRQSDRWLARGYRNARIVVPAVAFAVSAVLFALGLLASTVPVAVPCFVAAAFMLGAANPPLDAARLDIVTPWLWGRAESIRTLLRLVGEAAAPVCFGLLADRLAGTVGTARGANLRDTFLLMLVPLLANGLVTLLARRTYTADKEAAEAATPIEGSPAHR
ncbi:MFS transporter [Dactylosporangium salmoneum]|uniref:Major facilitator superfamily (MFS) profile domain-containing protein n=1 Tax=Dactylosporangium salmoneum TaxID=53361 RepID=A0ABN3FMC9_9ACTN